MNATTAALCAKPAIGVAIWLMNLCAHNQALHDAVVDLRQAGVVATQRFDVPMDEVYTLYLEQGGADDPTLAFACEHSSLLSLTIKVARDGEREATSQTFVKSCPFGTTDHSSIRFGQVRLRKGAATLQVVNDASMGLPSAGRARVVLAGVGVAD